MTQQMRARFIVSSLKKLFQCLRRQRQLQKKTSASIKINARVTTGTERLGTEPGSGTWFMCHTARYSMAAGGGRRHDQHCASGHFDFDWFGLASFALGQMHFEHAILELSLHFVRLRHIGQRKAPHETAVPALDAVIPLVLLLFFKL